MGIKVSFSYEKCLNFFFIGGILPKRIFQKHFSSKKEIPSTGIEATIPTAPVKAIATHFFFHGESLCYVLITWILKECLVFNYFQFSK
jgi:hypothetical protein